MKLSEFKEQVAALGEHDYEEADKLCFQWLKDASKDYGVNTSHIVLQLLTIVEEQMQ